jgi:hypothetical protein
MIQLAPQKARQRLPAVPTKIPVQTVGVNRSAEFRQASGLEQLYAAILGAAPPGQVRQNLGST